jgi:hypothetical protein
MSRDIVPNQPERDISNREPEIARKKIEPVARQVRDREIPYRITERERETLFDIGRFRTVAIEDLVSHRYIGNDKAVREDLRSLLAQGLVEKRTALVAQGRQKLAVLVLTKAGKRNVESGRADTRQAIYSGFVKPGEVAHDAAIYRMFHKEISRITSDGGVPKRVVLDYELKRNVYSPLAKARALAPLEYARRQAEIAHQNGLKVVNGKIPLPDLRIEYEDAGGEMAHVDLELATHHYHGSHLRTKAEAGFKIYGDASTTGRSPVFEEREITASILSL